MDRPDGLHELFCNILSSFGVWLWDPLRFDTDDLPGAIQKEAARHVYFQPPEGYRISYPCIVYELETYNTDYAGNNPYRITPRFRVTVIDKVPMSKITQKILELPTCRFNTRFRTDNLYHDVLTLHYTK